MILSSQVESIERVFGKVNCDVCTGIEAAIANALAGYRQMPIEILEEEFDFQAFFVTNYLNFKDKDVIEVGVKRFGEDTTAYWFFVDADFEVVNLVKY